MVSSSLYPLQPGQEGTGTAFQTINPSIGDGPALTQYEYSSGFSEVGTTLPSYPAVHAPPFSSTPTQDGIAFTPTKKPTQTSQQGKPGDGNKKQNAPGEYHGPPKQSWWDKAKKKAAAAAQAISDFDKNNDNILTRIGGGLQAYAGAAETEFGAGVTALGVATSEIGVGIPIAILGGFITANGVDNVQAGLTTAVTGQYTPTFGQQAVGAVVQALGGTPQQAQTAQTIFGIASSIGASGTVSAVRSVQQLGRKLFGTGAEDAGDAANNVQVQHDENAPREEKADPNCQTCAANPVQLSNGASWASEVEFELPGALTIRLDRFYYSRDETLGSLGRGMRSSVDRSISVAEDGRYLYRDEAHRKIYFRPPGPRPLGWQRNERHRALALAKGNDGSLILREGRLLHTFRRCPDGVYRLVRTEDRNGNRITFERDANGLLKEARHPSGLALAFTNDGNGRRTTVELTSPRGERSPIMRYEYDGFGNLVAAVSTHGASRYYGYDGQNRCNHWDDGLRTWANHIFDERGRVVKIETSGAWNGDTFEYDPARSRTKHIPGDRPDAFVWYRYDKDGRLTTTENADGEIAYVLYDDAADKRVAEIDEEGRRTSFTYDDNGWPISRTDPSGRTQRLFRDEDGNVILAQPAPGSAWRRHYDDQGTLVASVDPLGYRTDYTNDAEGRPVGIMRHDGLIEQRAYDAHGRLVALRDYRGETTRFERDAFGRVTAIRNPLGATTFFAYEAGCGVDFWTPTRVVRPDGVASERRVHRGTAETIAVDGEGRRTIYRYGAYDVLQEMEDANGGRLHFAHDGQKRLTRVTNQLGRHWTFERDSCGRVVAETDFDGLRTGYEHDRAGRLTAKIEADGTRSDYVTDEAGRLLKETVSTPGTAHALVTVYAYDSAGRLVQATNADAAVSFERDGLGRVVVETVNGRCVESTYDCCGNRTARRMGGRLVESAYDPLGALTRLTIGDAAPLEFTYDAIGRERRRSSPSGFALESRYDITDQLIAQAAGGLSPEPAVRRDYGWNAAFEPTSIADARWGETSYAYDANGQVNEARHGDGFTERFTYDAALNIESFSDAGTSPAGQMAQGEARLERASFAPSRGAAQRWTSSPGGRVVEARGPMGERVSYTHDALGRVIERRVTRDGFRPATWRYTWDGRSRLVGCETPQGERWAYGYDPFGRRVWKRRVGVADIRPEEPETDAPHGLVFSWDGDLLSAEAPLAADGTPQWNRAVHWHYEPGTFRPLARENAAGQLLYVVNDHLGTPREILDVTGELVWAAKYNLWGGLRSVQFPANDNESGSSPIVSLNRSRGSLALALSSTYASPEPAATICPIRFQGQWHDQEAGLSYNRFRHYDSVVGQYIIPDPIQLIGGSRPQSYVSNPLKFVDPFGLACCPSIQGSGTKLYHYTDAAGASGITGMSPEELAAMKPGETLPVDSLSFGQGTNPYLSENPGDVFATDLAPGDATQGQLNQLGIASDRQQYTIGFSQENAFNSGAQPVLQLQQANGIYSLPGGSNLTGGGYVITRNY